MQISYKFGRGPKNLPAHAIIPYHIRGFSLTGFRVSENPRMWYDLEKKFSPRLINDSKPLIRRGKNAPS